jgi:ABC-2 type transport system permease protein
VRLFAHELRAQQRLFWRSRELAFFTFFFPVLLFVLLGTVYGGDTIEGLKGSNYLLAGMLGYGVAATAFAGLAILLVIRREAGVLKRLRATPLPPATYLTAVLTSTVIVFGLEALTLVVLGRVLFGTEVPRHVVSLVLALLLGAIVFAVLALALTAVVRSAEGSSAVVNAIYLPMAFIAGSFFSPHEFPRVLRAIADVLPLTYFIRLVRDIMLHHQEIWAHGIDVAVLAAWGIAGAVFAVRRFRWEPREA